MGSAESTGARPVSASQLADVARDFLISQYGPLNRPVEVTVTFDARLNFVRAFVSPLPIPEPPDPAGEPGAALLDVIDLLASTGHRLTLDQILSGLDKQGTPHGESTVRRALAAAVKADPPRLTNVSDANPRGYGLPRWDAGTPADRP
jgi:hypothetical protein